MTEDKFRSSLVKRARELGWKTMFIGRGRSNKGVWITNMGGDGKGWPDLTLVRERIVFAELKTDVNYAVSPEERSWIASLKLAGAEVYLWRPRLWPEIETVLQHQDPDRWKRLLAASNGDVEQVAAIDRMLKARP